MNRLLVCCAGIITLFAVTARSIGEEMKPGPDYQQLKTMEWQIGDWEADWTVPPDGFPAPDSYLPGAKVHSTASTFWMENKNYLGFKFRDEIDGRVAHQGFEMIGVDPQTKKIVHWLFSILGGSGTGEWTLEGKTWKLKWSGTTGDGTRYEGTSFLVPLDANTYTWEVKDNKKNGKSGPDTPRITFHRVGTKTVSSSHRETTIPVDVLRELEFFVGDWKLTGTGAKGPMESSWSIGWAPGRHCLNVTYCRTEPERVIHGTGIWGWDSGTKEIVYYALYADPGLEHIRARIEQPGVFKGKYAGSLEGRKVDAACELRKEGANQYTFKTAGAAASGLGEIDVRFTRVNAEKSPPAGNAAFQRWGDYLAGGVWTTKDDRGHSLEDRWEWTVGKMFLRDTRKVDGKVDSFAEGGFDRQSGHYRYWVFDGEGYVLQGVNQWLDKEFLYHHTGQGKNGPNSVKGRCIRIAPDQLREEITKRIIDGKHLPPLVLTWTRQSQGKPAVLRAAKANPEDTAPKELKAIGDAMVGQWRGDVVSWGDLAKGKVGGRVPGRVSCRWILDGAALEWKGTIADGSFQGLSYWDPASKELKGFLVGSDGGYSEETTARGQGKWVSNLTLVGPDGKKTTQHYVTVFQGPDKHTNDYGTHHDVWERVEE